MSAADLAAVLGVVTEITCCHLSVLVTDETVRADILGVKLCLEFYVLSNCEQCRVELIYKGFLSFREAVDIRVVAISLISQCLKSCFIIVSGSETQYGEEYAAFFFLGDQIFKLIFRGYSHI